MFPHSDLESAIREEFEIPSSTDCRVWHCHMTHTYELLSQSDSGQVKNYTLNYNAFSCTLDPSCTVQ